MRYYKEHLISSSASINEALIKLELLGSDAILFVVDEKNTLIELLKNHFF